MSAGKILSGSATNYLRLFVQIGVQLGTTPIILNGVGKDAYGVWALVFSVLSIIGLLEFGVGAGSVKFAAEYRGHGDAERRNRAVSTLFAMGWCCAGVAIVGIGLLVALGPHIFSVPDSLQGTMRTILLLLGLRYAVLLWPLSVFQGLLYGDARIGTINVIQILSTLLYGAGCVLSIRMGYGIVGVAAANLATMLLEYAAYWSVAKRVTRDLQVRLSLFDRTVLQEAWKMALGQLIVAASGLILLRTDPLVIQAFLPIAAVSVYAVALRIAESAFLLVKQFINVLSPHIAERHGRGDEEGLRRMFLLSTRYALAPALVVTVPLVVYSRDVLVLWIGPNMAEGGPVLALLCLGMALMTPQVVASSFLTYTGRYLHASKPVIVGALVNIAASVILVNLMGLVGVAIGTLFAVVLVDVVWVGAIALQAMRVSLGQYVRESFLPLLPGGVVYAVLLIALQRLMPPRSLWEIALAGVVAVMVFGIVFAFTGLRVQDRERVLKRLRRANA